MEYGRGPKYFKMEDDLKILLNRRQPKFFENVRQHNIFEIGRQRRPQLFKIGRQRRPQFFWKWKTTVIFLKMEDNWNLFESGGHFPFLAVKQALHIEISQAHWLISG